MQLRHGVAGMLVFKRQPEGIGAARVSRRHSAIQLVLGAEVAVERHLVVPASSAMASTADASDAVLAEQKLRHLYDPLARALTQQLTNSSLPIMPRRLDAHVTDR